MNRKNRLFISLCNRLCEILDERLIIFWVNRPKLWPCFTEEEQKYFATVKKTEEEVRQEEIAVLDEIQRVLDEQVYEQPSLLKGGEIRL